MLSVFFLNFMLIWLWHSIMYFYTVETQAPSGHQKGFGRWNGASVWGPHFEWRWLPGAVHKFMIFLGNRIRFLVLNGHKECFIWKLYPCHLNELCNWESNLPRRIPELSGSYTRIILKRCCAINHAIMSAFMSLNLSSIVFKFMELFHP